MSMSTSDRPALTDTELRTKRAQLILTRFQHATGHVVPEEEQRGTLRWLETCLLAHETDTLAIVLRDAG